MAIAMQYGNGRNGLLNVGMSMTLLWTNVDDESAFAAQTLSLSLGGYDAVLIKFKLTASGSIYANTIGFVGEQTTLYSSNASTTSYTYKRYATVTTSDITFSTGYRGTTAGTSYAIPCEVYGIKRGGSSGGSSSSGSGGGGGGTGTLTQVTFDGTVYTDDGTGNVTLTESDPVFVASDAYTITSTDISNWNGKSDFSGDYGDLTNKPAIHNIPSGGTTGQVLAKSSSTDYDVGWVNQSAPAITETTESNAIANFTDGADDLVMHNIVAEIAPIQSGSGTPAPANIRPISGWTGCNVTRAGKNLFNWNRQLGTPNPTSGSNATSPRVMDVAHYYVGLRPDNYYYPSNVAEYNVSNGAITIRGTNNSYGVGFPIKVNENTTYTLSGTASANPHLAVGYYDAEWHYLGTYGKTGNTITFTTVANTAYAVVVLQSTSTSVAATWTNVQLELGSTATTYESYQGKTVTVDWLTEAGTVYGGTIDVATGLLTVTNGYIASYNGEALPSTWISDRDVYSSGTTPTTGAQVVYELATPQTYQLTPQEVKTLLGTNNVWANTGNVSVTYTADTKLYIEKLTMPTEDDLVANQAITSGKYFMIGNSLYLALANIANGAQITIGTNAQRVSLADALNTINA